MAGTLPGIGLTANNDLNGQPLAGCKLYVYQAGGVVIQTPYADSALSIALSWPLLGDAYGRLPFFWVPDGNYRVRLTDANDVIVYDYPIIPAVGASSSNTGTGGGTVDSTALFQTGDLMWLDVTGARAGWVRDNMKTIGSASSGATERANSDTQALYTWLWGNFADSICAVSGGRGGSASEDWAANKPIALPDKRNAVPGGLDDMGNTPAGRFASVPIISGGVTTAGSIIGETLHTLSTTEMPSHNHTITDNGHHHGFDDQQIRSGFPPDQFLAGGTGNGTIDTARNTADATTGITLAAAGGGGAHNNVQRTVLGTFYRKL